MALVLKSKKELSEKKDEPSKHWPSTARPASEWTGFIEVVDARYVAELRACLIACIAYMDWDAEGDEARVIAEARAVLKEPQ